MSDAPIKRPAIPSETGVRDWESLRRFLAPVKTLLEIHEGWRGRPGVDRFVPEGELQSVVGQVAQSDISSFIGNDTEAPGPPTSFLVTAGTWGNNILTWVNALDSDLYYVEVYVNTINSIAAGDGAERAGVVPAVNRQGLTGSFDHWPANIKADHYYWIRSVDWSGNYSEWVGDVSGGGNGAVAPGIDTYGEVIDQVMEILKGGVGEYADYDPSAPYTPGERVTYNGKAYQNYSPCTGIAPDSETPPGKNYWVRVGIVIEGDVDGVNTVGIDGNLVIDGTVLARHINVDRLSAIVADMGTLTAGSIVIGDTNKIWLNDSGDGALHIGGAVKGDAAFQVAANGIVTIRGGIIQSPGGDQFPVPCFRGAYNAAVTYYRGDVVTYGGNSWMYVSYTPSAGHTPADDIWWDLYVAAGVTQKTVKLSAGTLAFSYKTNGTLSGPNNTTLTATATAVSGVVYYEFRVNGSAIQHDTRSTCVYTPPAAFTSLPQKVDVRVREGSSSGTIVAEDQVSMIGLMAGSSAPTAVLTNGSHTIPSAADGTVASYNGSGTGIMAWIGATRLNYDGAASPAANTFKVSAAGSGITPNASPYTIGGNYRYYGDASNMTAITATITFTVTITDANQDQATISLEQTFSKSQTGSAGVSSRTVSLVASHMAAAFDTAGNLISPAAITLTATSLNTEGTPYYQFYDKGSSMGAPSTSNVKSLTMTGKTWSDMPRSILVELREGSGSGQVLATDMISIVGLRAGSDAITVSLPNSSHTVPTASDGTVSSYVGSGSTLKVWDGTTALNYYTSLPSTAGFTVGTPTVSPSGGITVGSLSGSGTPTCTIGVHSNMSASVDTVTITFPITVRKQDLSTVVTSVVQTITKSKAGAVAKGLSLSATSQVFQIAKSGTISPSSITFTATGQNLSGSPTFTTMPTVSLSGSGATRTLSSGAMSADAVTVTVTWDSLTDTITVVKVREGSDAYTVILTNEAHVVACNADGTPVTGELGASGKAISDVVVYRGATPLTPTTNSSPSAGYFYFSRSDSGCTSVKADSDTFYLSALSADSGKVSVTVNCEGQASITKEFTFTKAKMGTAGSAGAGVTYRGEWVTSRAYVGTAWIRDVVKYSGSYYICQASHTSGSWATDLAAGHWVSFGSTFSSVATDLLLSQDVTITRSMTFGGEGAASFLNITGDYGLIVDAANGVKFINGSDLHMWGTSGDRSRIVFHTSSYLMNIGADYSNNHICMWPSTGGYGQVVIGWNDGFTRQQFNGFGVAVDHGIWLLQDNTTSSYYDSSLSMEEGVVSLSGYSVSIAQNASSDSSISMASGSVDVDADSNVYITAGTQVTLTAGSKGYWFAGSYVCPSSHITTHCGHYSYSWDNCYADDFVDRADWFFMDDWKNPNTGHVEPFDDLAAIRAIGPRGSYDGLTGFQLIDDDTIPSALLVRHKRDETELDEDGAVVREVKRGEVVRAPGGEPYLSLKTMISLVMGAVRQLDDRLGKVENHKG